MDAMEKNFIRKVVLNATVPMDLKSEGLDVLLSDAKEDSREVVADFNNIRARNAQITFGLSRDEWKKVDVALYAGKIPAIKALRSILENDAIILGLMEAKEAVEDDKFWMQRR